MALRDILKSIDEKANKEIQTLEKQAETKKADLIYNWRQKIDAKKEELLAESRRQADNQVRQATFMIKSQIQQELLAAKQEVIDRAYEAALDKLKNLDDEKYIELMTKLLAAIPEAEGEVISAEGKEDLLQKALKASGKKYNLTAKTSRSAGGFVFSSKKLDIDNTFEALVKNVKDATETEVAKILFAKK